MFFSGKHKDGFLLLRNSDACASEPSCRLAFFLPLFLCVLRGLVVKNGSGYSGTGLIRGDFKTGKLSQDNPLGICLSSGIVIYQLSLCTRQRNFIVSGKALAALIFESLCCNYRGVFRLPMPQVGTPYNRYNRPALPCCTESNIPCNEVFT